MSQDILPEPSRRAFLTGACAIMGLSVGAVLVAEDASAAPGIKRLPYGRVQVTVSKVSGLAKPGGVVALGNVKGIPTVITRTQAGNYTALDLLCPAHGSQFALDGALEDGALEDGALERGPSTKGPARVRSRMSGGVLTIG